MNQMPLLPASYFLTIAIAAYFETVPALVMPPKKPPTSKFKSGAAKFDSPFKGGKKDDRNVLLYNGAQNGILTCFLKKPNADEEPYALHDYNLLKESPDLMETLNINAVLSRKDTTSSENTELMQSPTSTYPWRQFVLLIGENNNTPPRRRQYAQALVDHLNTQATSANYRYVRKVKLGSDLSNRPLVPVDRVLLDGDVVGLMLAAYESTPLEELATYDTIMRTFWTDIAHGREVLAESAAPEGEAAAEVAVEAAGGGEGNAAGGGNDEVNPFAESSDEEN
jgi:hypothetical protein